MLNNRETERQTGSLYDAELAHAWEEELQIIDTFVFFSVGHISSPTLIQIVTQIATDYGMELEDEKVFMLLQTTIKEAVDAAHKEREDLNNNPD